MKKLLFLFLLPLAVLADPGKIELAKATLDASKARLMDVAAQTPSPSGTRLYLAQPVKNFTIEERKAVTDLGLSFYGHVPPNAYVLEGTEKQISELKENFSFLYLGEFLPEYKTVCELDPIASASYQRRVLVTVTRSEFLPSVEKVLDKEGVKYEVASETFCPSLIARLTAAQIARLAKMGEVASIENYSDPVAMNDVARSDYCCNLEDLIMDGYDGSTQTVCLHDTGLDNGDVDNIHPDFKGKRVSGRATSGVANERGGYDKWYDSSGHGTHVAGSMCGNGSASDGQFKGMAPAASIFVLAAGGAAGIYAGTDSDLEITYEEGARIMNNSWGSKSDNGAYNNISRTYDTLIWNHPDYTVCFASGNWNTKLDLPTECTLSKGACSKNAITVGASESYRPTESPDACPDNGRYQGLFSLSGRGPCSDGRVKPDIVAPGSCIYSCNASREHTSVRSEYYVSKTGCSMSSPIAAGCAAVIRDYLVKNRGVDSPSASLVKAIMLCGARTLYPGQFGGFLEVPDSRPNYAEGHGQVNIQQSLEPIDGDMLFEEFTLNETGSAVTNYFEKYNENDLAVGLVWSDYPGTIGAAKALVNDLDLTVIAPNGARSNLDDHINNVEVIRLSGPAGRYTVIVRGTNIMSGPQPCSLVFNYGSASSPYPITATPPRETSWSKLDLDTTSKTRLLLPTYPIPYSTAWNKKNYDRRISVPAVDIDDPDVTFNLLTTAGEETGTYVWDYTSLFPTNFPYKATYCLKYRIFNGATTFEAGTSKANFTLVPEPGIALIMIALGLPILLKRKLTGKTK
ncbi:S8 family serine peptidase [bacterium]|nr:S8 family serine peptidase [bacterium]